jgi:hypothetical protein
MDLEILEFLISINLNLVLIKELAVDEEQGVVVLLW